MSRVLAHAPASPWQRGISAAAQAISGALDARPGDAGPRTVLWWGGGYSALRAEVGDGHIAVLATTGLLDRASGDPGSGYSRKARLLHLHDLRAGYAGLQAMLAAATVRDIAGYLALQERIAHHLESAPAIAAGSVDVVVADFLLNRVEAGDVQEAFAEACRVLEPAGCMLAAILVSDEPLPAKYAVQCGPPGPPLRIPTEMEAVRAFQQAGFHGITLHWPDPDSPVALDRVGDAEIRMCLVEAHLGKRGACMELGQAVIYRGPWSEIRDDDDHVYARGVRTAVCGKTYDLLMRPPYAGAFIGLRSVNEPMAPDAAPFDCDTPALRDPRVTKGLQSFSGERQAGAACAAGSGCC